MHPENLKVVKTHIWTMNLAADRKVRAPLADRNIGITRIEYENEEEDEDEPRLMERSI